MTTAHLLQLHAHCICVFATGTREENQKNFGDKKVGEGLFKGHVLTGQG